MTTKETQTTDDDGWDLTWGSIYDASLGKRWISVYETAPPKAPPEEASLKASASEVLR